MSTRPSSIRIAEGTRRYMEETCRRTGRDFSSLANEMLAEAVRMRRIPGIVFHDSPAGRAAVVAGTGIRVAEVVRSCREMGCNWERLRAAYHWLSEAQLRSVLAYAEAYPEEIEERLQQEERWSPEAVWATYPFTKPR